LLETKTLTGPYYQRSLLLHSATKQYSVFIQSDKSTYKPSDVVQFRVLVLNQDTKPFNASNVEVFITDAENNRLKQWSNISLDHGVFKNEFNLSDSPALGPWNVHVKVNDEKETNKQFIVARYVLPKFEVTATADPFLTFKDETLKVTVSAKYTFGKSVKGNATVVVASNSWRSSQPSIKTVNVDGKKTIEFDLKKDLLISDDDYTQDINIDVTFAEDLTGNEATAKTKTSVHKNRHEIKMDAVKEKFKPGLPVRFQVTGKLHDGTPVSDERNKVKVTMSFYQKPFEQYCGQEALNETFNATLKNGVAAVEFNTTKDYEHLEFQAEYLKEIERMNFVKEESKGENFIQANLKSKK